METVVMVKIYLIPHLRQDPNSSKRQNKSSAKVNKCQKNKRYRVSQ